MWLRVCDRACVSREALRHPVSVAAPPMRHTWAVARARYDTLAMSPRYTNHVAPWLCDTRIVPLAAVRAPNTALKVARTDTELASCGAQRAKTGTAFFGYIIATTLENTDFVDCFHNQIATAWLAFLNAPFLLHQPCAASCLGARHFSAMGAGCLLILMTNRLRALLLTAHAECR